MREMTLNKMFLSQFNRSPQSPHLAEKTRGQSRSAVTVMTLMQSTNHFKTVFPAYRQSQPHHLRTPKPETRPLDFLKEQSCVIQQ